VVRNLFPDLTYISQYSLTTSGTIMPIQFPVAGPHYALPEP